MRHLLIISTILFSNLLFSQSITDSLESRYESTNNPIDKQKVAFEIASRLRNVNNQKSLKYVDLSILHCQENKDKYHLAKSYELKGSILTGTGETKNALSLLFAATQVYESIDSIGELAMTYNSIGNAYLDLEDIDKCKKYYQMSYELALTTKDSSRIAVPIVGLGIAHSEVGEYEKALDYSCKAADMFEGIGRMDAYCISLANAASYAYEANKKSTADSLMNKAKIAATEMESIYFKAEILLMESDWLADAGKYDSAIEKAERGIDLMKQIDARSNIMNATKFLSEYYANSFDFKSAYSALLEHIELKDSLNEENKIEIVEELNTKYETSQKEQKILELASQNELQELENQKNKTIIYISIGAAILLFGLVVFSVWGYIQKKHLSESLHKRNSVIRKKNREILDSINYAQRIQNAIIPSHERIERHLKNSFVIYLPKDIVAGDFYWLESVEDKVLLAVADCTGHGVPGALLSVICHNALNRSVKEFKLSRPSEILDKTREIVISTLSENNQEMKDGMDISLCAWDQKTNQLEWAGANNPLYIVRNESETIEILNPDKQPIGEFKDKTNYTHHELSLTKGDTFYLFSDGYVDQFGGKDGKKFKYAQFRQMLIDVRGKSMSSQSEHIYKSFVNWKDDLEQIDDVCILGVQV